MILHKNKQILLVITGIPEKNAIVKILNLNQNYIHVLKFKCFITFSAFSKEFEKFMLRLTFFDGKVPLDSYKSKQPVA